MEINIKNFNLSKSALSSLKNVSLSNNIEKGTVFSGDISDIRGKLVTINLGNNNLLTALLEGSFDFNIGEKVNFYVKSNDGNKIVLKPVKSEEKVSDTVLKSLQNAGIPQTENTINMVNKMMENAFSIDKNSLNDMAKLINSNKDVPIDVIIALKANNLEVNPENIKEFTRYMQFENSIKEDINTFSKDVKEFIMNFNNEIKGMELNPDGKREFLEKLFKVFINENQEESSVQKNPVLGLKKEDGVNPQSNFVQVSLASAEEIIKSPINIVNDEVVLKEGEVLKPQMDVIEELPMDKKVLSKEALIMETIKNIENPIDREFLEKISKDISDVIKEKYNIPIENLIENQEEFVKKIRESYKSLIEDNRNIMEFLKENNLKDTNIYKSASNIQSNVDFMGNLNNFLSYIQIPLKTSLGEANSELYVYNRKNKKEAGDESVSAFLHFDMENLGGTDILVKLENNKLSADFTLLDEDSRQIVKEHLFELKERLDALGFNTEINVLGEKRAEFTDILEKDKKKISIKRASFDVRA